MEKPRLYEKCKISRAWPPQKLPAGDRSSVLRCDCLLGPTLRLRLFLAHLPSFPSSLPLSAGVRSHGQDDSASSLHLKHIREGWSVASAYCASTSWVQVILLPRPPKKLGSQKFETSLGNMTKLHLYKKKKKEEEERRKKRNQQKTKQNKN
ncbi:hypothetical protein AAY473_037700 [Plecturocebus cupreus]